METKKLGGIAALLMFFSTSVMADDGFDRHGQGVVGQWGLGGIRPRNFPQPNFQPHATQPHSFYPTFNNPRGDEPRFNQPRNDFYYGNSNAGYDYGHFERIVQRGIESGALSRAEVRDLREHLRQVQRSESYYWSDGRLSYRERQQLSYDYASLRNDLEHQLRDGERRNAGFY